MKKTLIILMTFFSLVNTAYSDVKAMIKYEIETKGLFCDAEVKNMEMLNPLEFCQDFVSRRGEEIRRPSSFWDAKGILTGFTLGILAAFGVLKFFRNVT